MKEKLLYYIWQFQVPEMNAICCTVGKKIEVISCGEPNKNQGPDFIHATIKYDNTIWVGQIEIHVFSSDWFRHQHQVDPNYNNVILHVVWEHDIKQELSFPTIELKQYVSAQFLDLYQKLMQEQGFIACANKFTSSRTIVLSKWLETMMAERMISKAKVILDELANTLNHWEEVCWRMICRGFGGKVNGEAFYQLSKSLPWSLLRKYRSDRMVVEALFMGQMKLIPEESDEVYWRNLRISYTHVQKKHKLIPVTNRLHFLRMRPAAFPTIRLSQLAAFVHAHESMMSDVMKMSIENNQFTFFDLEATSYWDNHFMAGRLSANAHKKIAGNQFQIQMIVNVVVPMIFAFGWHHHDEKFKSTAMRLLEQLPPENNQVIRGFETFGIGIKTAFDTQSLLQLKSAYCDRKKCLDCAIGNELLGVEQRLSNGQPSAN